MEKDRDRYRRIVAICYIGKKNINAWVVRHGRYVTFQMAEVAIPRDLFADILRRIDRLRPKPAPT